MQENEIVVELKWIPCLMGSHIMLADILLIAHNFPPLRPTGLARIQWKIVSAGIICDTIFLGVCFFCCCFIFGICTFQVVLCGETKLLLPKKPGWVHVYVFCPFPSKDVLSWKKRHMGTFFLVQQMLPNHKQACLSLCYICYFFASLERKLH